MSLNFINIMYNCHTMHVLFIAEKKMNMQMDEDEQYQNSHDED